jgi:DNA-binding transcriptional MerR regulator
MGAVDKAPDAFRTISEVAEDLNVPQHVLRFWESRFRDIKPMKRGGGRRYYRPDDVDLLRGIRHLLYGEGYTIRGVQRILREQGVKFVQAVWQPGAPQPSHGRTEDGDVAPEEAEAAARPGVPAETERRRGLFGLLPTLLGDDIGERTTSPSSAESRQEPRAVLPPRIVPPAGLAGGSPGAMSAPLPKEDVRRLRAALRELGECRKLIDAALSERA